MKKPLLSLLVLALAPLCAWALNPSETTTLYKHLVDVNAQWKNIEPSVAQLQPASFKNDTRRIQAHLFNTIQHLRNQPTGHLPAGLQQKRARLLAVLQGYAEAAVFPQNYDFSYRIPYFIDAHNTACAVGYLIIADGHRALAEMIRKTDNYQYLLDMQYPELNAWVANSGFTAQELALIQPGYEANVPFSHLTGNSGTDGHVNHVVTVDGKTYIAGSFASVGGTSGFGNIAYLSNGTWVQLDGGLDGEVHAMAVYNNELYVGGNFAGSANGIASEGLIKWTGTEWLAVNTLGFYGDVYTLQVHNDKLYVGGDFEFPTGALRGYLMAIDGTTGMMLPDFPMGPVHSLAIHDGELVVGGEFTTTFNATPLSNVAILDDMGNMVSVGGGINTPVFALASYMGDLYIGGRFYASNGDTLMGFAYWNDTSWVDESMAIRGSVASEHEIYALMVDGDDLYMGGDFSCCDAMIAYYGTHVAQYNRTSGAYGYMQGLTNFDAAVHTLGIYNDELMVGGAFNLATFGQTMDGTLRREDNLGGLAMKDEDWTSINPIDNSLMNVAVYPVPASGKVTFRVNVEVLTAQPTITVLNTLGQEVQATSLTATLTEMDITSLPSGVYIYHLHTSAGHTATGRFVME